MFEGDSADMWEGKIRGANRRVSHARTRKRADFFSCSFWAGTHSRKSVVIGFPVTTFVPEGVYSKTLVLLPQLKTTWNYISKTNKKLRNVIQVPQLLTHIFYSFIHAHLSPCVFSHSYWHCFFHGQAEQICCVVLNICNATNDSLNVDLYTCTVQRLTRVSL